MGVAGFQGAFDDIRNGTYGESNDWEYEDYDTDSTYDDSHLGHLVHNNTLRTS